MHVVFRRFLTVWGIMVQSNTYDQFPRVWQQTGSSNVVHIFTMGAWLFDWFRIPADTYNMDRSNTQFHQSLDCALVMTACFHYINVELYRIPYTFMWSPVQDSRTPVLDVCLFVGWLGPIISLMMSHLPFDVCWCVVLFFDFHYFPSCTSGSRACNVHIEMCASNTRTPVLYRVLYGRLIVTDRKCQLSEFIDSDETRQWTRSESAAFVVYHSLTFIVRHFVLNVLDPSIVHGYV